MVDWRERVRLELGAAMTFCPTTAGEAFSASETTGESSCERLDARIERMVIN